MNLIIFDWKQEWGGHLNLWEGTADGLTREVARVAPRYNTAVLFLTSDIIWHGVPDELCATELPASPIADLDRRRSKIHERASPFTLSRLPDSTRHRASRPCPDRVLAVLLMQPMMLLPIWSSVGCAKPVVCILSTIGGETHQPNAIEEPRLLFAGAPPGRKE